MKTDREAGGPIEQTFTLPDPKCGPSALTKLKESRALSGRERRKDLGCFKMGRQGWAVAKGDRANTEYLKPEQAGHTFPAGGGPGGHCGFLSRRVDLGRQ